MCANQTTDNNVVITVKVIAYSFNIKLNKAVGSVLFEKLLQV